MRHEFTLQRLEQRHFGCKGAVEWELPLRMQRPFAFKRATCQPGATAFKKPSSGGVNPDRHFPVLTLRFHSKYLPAEPEALWLVAPQRGPCNSAHAGTSTSPAP